MTDSIRCCSCSRVNDPWRRYCGECGEILQPGCRCGFANGRQDRYCGGCGSSLRISYADLTVPAIGRTLTPLRVGERVSTQQIALLCDVVALDPDT